MKCEICGESSRRVVRDHDHATGLIRGSLCDPCNSKLGTYERRLRKPRKDKGRYLKWIQQYRDQVETYLSKDLFKDGYARHYHSR